MNLKGTSDASHMIDKRNIDRNRNQSTEENSELIKSDEDDPEL